MSVRRLAEKQPESFEFTPENRAWAEEQIAKYPPGRQASAVISLLWRAQKQNAYWLSKPAIEKVAEMLAMPKIRVLEVATFYTMFNLAPVGKFYVQLCGTTPCVLRGAESIRDVLRRRIGEPGHVTADGLFSWNEVECLGACCNAPMAQINDDYYEDLTAENFSQLLDDLAAGRPVRVGSQTGRVGSEPAGGPLTALTTLYGADGWSGPASAPRPANDAATPKAEGRPGAAPAPAAPAVAAIPPHDEATAASSPALAVSAPAPPNAVANIPPLIDSQAQERAALEEAHINETLAKLPADATAEQKANAVGLRPFGLPAPRESGPDDLQRVTGVGPADEKGLHSLGVFHFDQIAGWTRPEVRWVGTFLAEPGRIDREQWVAQAANLAHGGHGAKDSDVPTHVENAVGTSAGVAVAAHPSPGAFAAIPRLDDVEAQAHAEAEEAHIRGTLARLPKEASAEEKANAVGARPIGLPAPRNDRADDLQRIKGVGPVNEGRLHGLGVFHFDQIAAWTRPEIRWVATYLAFPGRIDREQWVAQAANLAHGGHSAKDVERAMTPAKKPEA